MSKKVKFVTQHRGRSMTAEVVDTTSDWCGRQCAGEPVAQVGDIAIDLYDCSDEIEEYLGGDYAWVTLIALRDKPALVRALAKEEPGGEEEDEDWRILNFVKSQFQSTLQVNQWLEIHEIPFRKFLDDTYIIRELAEEG